MSHVLVSGSIAYDRIMDFPGHFRDHFLAHKLHTINVSFAVDGVEENFGGTAGNIAYNLALLGHDPRIISTAGSDFSAYRKYFEGEGIATDTVHIDTSELTSSAYIITDKADNQIAAFSFGAGKRAYGEPGLTEGIACAIVGAGNTEDMRRLPAFYRERKIPYFYDPAQQIPILSGDDLRAGIEGAAGLFGNDYEIELMTQKTEWSEKELSARVPFVVVTLGAGGTRIMTKESTEKVKAVHVPNVVDPTGAGDAYRAGFLAGHLGGLPPRVSAQIGSTAAVYAIEQSGTQNHRFTMQEFAGRYEEAYGEKFPL
ncbi:carbohydrate kinase family protein [Candidatus Parcubacteria bacterium]|nr:MAG: carbohydrate kinase family protein [Candidatus Parcubacteria bacterium]